MWIIKFRNWYNDFSKQQIKTSINLRHYTLFNKIVNAGLKKESKILEIGCGIGTLTGLLYSYNKFGHIVAADISDESIEIAKRRIGISERIDYVVTDMITFEYKHKFDFIILPDVMEHIPVEQHENLFKVISIHMHPSSKVVINIPHPKAIEFLRKNSPEKLQIIDQPLSADKLISDAYQNNLVLESYNSYSIFNNQHDFAFIIFENYQSNLQYKK
ncbi:MAG: class I SAM-dependent methyltransferase [Saprospiraceae bacterium]|nr:class I SAM-dependent methyltransferase [Saprospiraceae bacterium]